MPVQQVELEEMTLADSSDLSDEALESVVGEQAFGYTPTVAGACYRWV